MSAVEDPSSLFDEERRAEPADATFLASLPPHLQRVTARVPLTRESLPRRGKSMDDPQLSEATQHVWDAEKRTALCLADKYRALADLFEHDGGYEEVTELDDVDTLRAGLALRVTRSAAGWQLRDAYQAVHLFPQCLSALESGAFPAAWFQKMLKTSRQLSDSSRKNLDIAVASWSPDITAERFFTLLKKLIALLEQREDRPDPLSSLTRSVDLLPSVEPGMGTIQINGPIPDILAQWKQLDESARAVQAAQRAALRDGTPIPHDPDGTVLDTGKALPLSQLRFALMATAALDLDGVHVPAERFRLNITIPALTLLGASDEPGSLDGTIPLPPALARSLAGSTDTWYRVLTDACSGAFLPLPADKFEPTAAMLEHLRLRNAQCAVPGCTRPVSWASECDHIEECLRGTPGAGGLTEIENLHLLCWQHHLDKTNGLLDPTRLQTRPTEPGRTRWAVGRHGDVVTVIDDLDTASIQIAEDLERAWIAFLRGTYAGEPATEPVTSEAEPPSPPRTPPPRPPRIPPPPPPPPPPPGGTEIPPGPWDHEGPPPF
ncbi:HNH endonuclease signature motif containing protein [uncultured Brachybacterium sp.]|uniref:HNH endonuclease signature motif containing protein n=1 Tax=uncultured Brachybacterium sp. TaxID=189680 RepID=UPI0026125125|nr:HNH endonuclease signature motif containing protein [uncultured Brachybacterium sp.]